MPVLSIFLHHGAVDSEALAVAASLKSGGGRGRCLGNETGSKEATGSLGEASRFLGRAFWAAFHVRPTGMLALSPQD